METEVKRQQKVKEKKELSKHSRYSIIAIGIIIGIGGILLILSQTAYQKTIEKTAQIGAYEVNGGVNYQVKTKPNELYGKSVLPEGMHYVSEYVDNIDVALNYTMKTSEAVTIEGTYDVALYVRGYYTKEEKKYTIWEKKEIIKSQIPIKVTGNTYEIEEHARVRLREYQDFARRIMESSFINSNVELEIVLQGTWEGELAEQSIGDAVSIGINLPLHTNYFEITKVEQEQKEEKLTRTYEEVVQPQVMLIGVGIGGLIVMIVLIGYVLIRTECRVKEDKTGEKKRKRLFEIYQERLVEIKELDEGQYTTVYQIIKVEDMIKLADEYETPILYEYKEVQSEVDVFYIEANSKLYKYELDTQKSDDVLPKGAN